MTTTNTDTDIVVGAAALATRQPTEEPSIRRFIVHVPEAELRAAFRSLREAT
jgi:hypothetical protein